MKRTKTIFSILIFLTAAAGINAADRLTDPYEILNKHYEAIGGLEKVKAQKTEYSEAEFEIIGSGMKGTVKDWQKYPQFSRTELDFGFFKMVNGDSGQYRWTVDPNGKLHINKDEKTIKQRKVTRLLADYEQLNPNSEQIKVTLEGIEKVQEKDCYVIKISNTINEEYRLEYYAISNFYLMKTTSKTQDTTEIIYFSDFNKVEGIIRPFKSKIEILPLGQKISATVKKLTTKIELDDSFFSLPGKDVKDFKFKNGKSSENIPFKYIGNHIYLPIEIEGKKTLWILDTGASRTVIDTRYAKQIGLKLEGKMKGQGAGNKIDVYFVDLPSFGVEGIRFDKQKAIAIDLWKLTHKIIGVDAVGILGYDFLSRFVTKIDYAKEKISFYDPETFKYSGTGKVIDFELMDNHLSMPMTVDGKYSGQWRFDTGAGSTGFHYPYAKEKGITELDGVDFVGHGAGGRLEAKGRKFNSIEFAGYSIPELVFSFPVEEMGGAFAVKSLIGNIGNDILEHFVIYLDYKNSKMIVEKGDDFDRVFPMDKSGLQLMLDDNDNISTFFVSPGTPSDKAGFKEKDIIKKIDNKAVGTYGGLVKVGELFEKDEGTVYKILVQRDGKEIELQLTLKNMF